MDAEQAEQIVAFFSTMTTEEIRHFSRCLTSDHERGVFMRAVSLTAWSSDRPADAPIPQPAAAARTDVQDASIVRATDPQSSRVPVGHVNPRGGRVVSQRQGRQANPKKLRIHAQMRVEEIRRLQSRSLFAQSLPENKVHSDQEKARLRAMFFTTANLKSVWEAIGWKHLPKPLQFSNLEEHVKHAAIVAVHRLFPDWPDHVIWEAIDRAAKQNGR